MHKVKILPLILTLGLLAAGCTSTTITNLTPKQEPRNANGFYQVEAQMNSHQQSIRWETIEPKVIVGKDVYPMRLTPLLTNRWETLVPVPAGNSAIKYHFKFDYKFNDFGVPPQPDSKLSPDFELHILDR